MTSIKKVAAIVLAFMMIFSSASVLASAVSVSDFEGGTALSIETKFFKQNAGGEWVETERVAPGSSLKARVYVGTDYYSNDSTLLFFYDKDFFTYSGSGDALTVNPAADSFAQANGVTGYLNSAPNLTGIVNKGYITSDYLNDYAAIVVNIEVHAANESNVMYDASDWLFEIDLTVPQGVSGTGDIFVNPDTIQNTTDRTDAVISVPKGDSNGTDVDLWPMWLWDADVSLASQPVSTESKVTFNANDGVFESDSLDSHEVTGTIASELALHEEPKREGYTFLGWDDASVEGEKAEAQPETFPELDLVLNAVWVKNVNITFVTGEGGTDIPALTDKTPGTAFPTISNPIRDGFTFLYWDTEDGKLPDVYPAEDTTYTAIWALNVTMTFEPDNGDAATVIPGYAGKEFDSSTAPVPAKDGYEFMGWEPALPTQFPDESETYTAVYEKKTYTVRYYIVEDGIETLVKAYRVMYGEVVPTDILAASSEGYVFNGWYTDAALSNVFEDGTEMGGENLKLYASYEHQIYDAIFDAAGGYFDGDPSKTEVSVPTEFDTDIVAPAAPEREGYEFIGWTPAVGVMDSAGKTFSASWAAIPDHYSITYMYKGIGGLKDEVFYVSVDELFESPADPYVEGYEFEGWAPAEIENPTADDVVELPTVMPAENLEYVAVFTAVSANATFYEFKDTDRGPAYNTESIGYDVYDQNAYIFGQTIVMPAVPALVNTAGESIDAYYTFLHWVDDEGNTYAADAVIEMTGAINFYPVYERVTVKLVPVEGSTTVIERGSEDSYDDWFIYGLEVGLDNADGILDSFIEVQGDGYYDVEYVTGTAVGTGVKISVYDNFDTSAPVEEFHIIIFGDVTGDGYIMAADANIVKLVVNDFTSLDTEWLFKAADVISDGYIMAADANIVRLVVNDFATLDQVTGLAQ